MERLTEKWEYNKKHSYTYKGLNPSMYEDITDKLGRIEDLMEKYEINSIEALEEIIKDYDDMAKDIVEMGLGVKMEFKDKSE